jgi:hypothetical protein
MSAGSTVAHVASLGSACGAVQAVSGTRPRLHCRALSFSLLGAYARVQLTVYRG